MNLEQSVLLDTTGREAILKELDKNLFVIAGAGSGKTTTLVGRMVAMVKSGIDISKICAITFTKKAAAEFLSRFQKELKEESANKDNSDENRLRCKVALEKIDLCFTGTIDSFCNLVLSEYPNNANIPSSSAIVEDDEFIELCKKEFEKIANDDNSPIKGLLVDFNRLVRNGADTFSRSIRDVMNVSHLSIQYPVPAKTLDEAVKELANKYENKIHNDISLLIKMKADVNQDPNGKPQESFDELLKVSNKLLSKWTVENFVSIRKTIKNTFTKWLRFDDQPITQFFEFGKIKQTYKCLEKDDCSNLQQYFDDVDNIVYSYCMHFLVKAANTIKENLRKQGKLSFTEYLMIFRDMVIEDMNHGMKLINHIKKKHSYFLIDESQDTSPAQTELFIYLTSEVEAHSLKDCRPKPGSIFIVGDPKQSIYGFRGADVDAYLDTKKLFESVFDQNYNKVVYLTKNFRSTYELREYFNEKFKDLANYEPIPLDLDKTPKEISSDVLSGVYSSTNYLSAIKSLVGKHYIFDKKLYKEHPETLGKRLIEYKDIMLLTWSTTNHGKVINELKANNIPFYCEGNFYLTESEVIETIYALYAYISNEDGQFYNLLSSPLFNASPNDLLGIYSVNDMPEGKEKDFILSLEPLRDSTDPVILLKTIIERLKLYQYIDFANIEYALFLLEKLKEQVTSSKISDIRSGEKFLRTFLTTQVQRCMNMELVPNAVNLANVHKVKGLEKPVVILVECKTSSQKPKSDSDYLSKKAYIFRTGEKDWKNLKLFDVDCGDLYSLEQETAKAKKTEEAERLAYVAVTRARNILVQTTSAGSTDPWNGVRIDSAKSIPFSDLEVEDFGVANPFHYDEPASFNSNQTYKERSPSKEKHITSKFSDEVVDTPVEEDIDSRTKGTIVHRLMEKIVNSKGKLPKDALIQSILNEYSLDKFSPYTAILESVYERMFDGGFPQKNGVFADLLSILFKSKCECEVPFSYPDGNNIWQGEIDLVYVLDGQYYIVDYKTNADDSELDKIYVKQLEAYKKILKISLGVDAIAYIYHIDA